MTKLITLTSTKDVPLGGRYRMTSLKGVITLEGKVVGKVVMDAFPPRSGAHTCVPLRDRGGPGQPGGGQVKPETTQWTAEMLLGQGGGPPGRNDSRERHSPRRSAGRVAPPAG